MCGSLSVCAHSKCLCVCLLGGSPLEAVKSMATVKLIWVLRRQKQRDDSFMNNNFSPSLSLRHLWFNKKQSGEMNCRHNQVTVINVWERKQSSSCPLTVTVSYFSHQTRKHTIAQRKVVVLNGEHSYSLLNSCTNEISMVTQNSTTFSCDPGPLHGDPGPLHGASDGILADRRRNVTNAK